MDAFSVFIPWFYRNLKVIPTKDKPCILFLDNHSSRFLPATLRFAQERFLHIWSLLPNSTAFAQPLDATAGPFRTIKVSQPLHYFNTSTLTILWICVSVCAVCICVCVYVCVCVCVCVCVFSFSHVVVCCLI
jgi:hypothetical protein